MNKIDLIFSQLCHAHSSLFQKITDFFFLVFEKKCSSMALIDENAQAILEALADHVLSCYMVWS